MVTALGILRLQWDMLVDVLSSSFGRFKILHVRVADFVFLLRKIVVRNPWEAASSSLNGFEVSNKTEPCAIIWSIIIFEIFNLQTRMQNKMVNPNIPWSKWKCFLVKMGLNLRTFMKSRSTRSTIFLRLIYQWPRE